MSSMFVTVTMPTEAVMHIRSALAGEIERLQELNRQSQRIKPFRFTSYLRDMPSYIEMLQTTCGYIDQAVAERFLCKEVVDRPDYVDKVVPVNSKWELLRELKKHVRGAMDRLNGERPKGRRIAVNEGEFLVYSDVARILDEVERRGTGRHRYGDKVSES